MNTVLCSDLGLVGSPRPIDGYREIVGHLLDLQFTEAEIKRLTGGHAAELLGSGGGRLIESPRNRWGSPLAPLRALSERGSGAMAALR